MLCLTTRFHEVRAAILLFKDGVLIPNFMVGLLVIRLWRIEEEYRYDNVSNRPKYATEIQWVDWIKDYRDREHYKHPLFIFFLVI